MTGIDRRGLVGLLLAGAAAPSLAWGQAKGTGVSPEGLAAFHKAFDALVDEGKLAGVVTLVARRGKVADLHAHGLRDLDAKAPLKTDTIFRIASMTKPIVGVAMMILFEEGKWRLDDPVARHIPEFKDLMVAKAGGGTEPMARPMTMAQLMSHTAGFDGSAGYANANLREKDLQVMVQNLAKLPLATQPGTDWRYGPVVDIQGYVVEKLSGQTLDVFLRTRIFEPLKMPDTGFWVSPEKKDRVARINTYDAAGKLISAPNTGRGDPTVKPVFLSGSGGLLSTATDYWRFCQMLLNGGQLDGVRILKPATVELMRRDVLEPGVAVDLYGPAQAGVGFGLDFAVLLDPAAAKSPQGKGSYWWGGAFGTWFWIDPVNDLIVVGMIQNVGGSTPGRGTPEVRGLSARLIYPALQS